VSWVKFWFEAKTRILEEVNWVVIVGARCCT